MRSSPRRMRPASMAGWLFADLFLFLMIAGLASIQATPAAVHKQPTPSSSPSPSAPAHNQGLNPHYLTIYTSLSPESFRAGRSGELVSEVETKLNQLDPAHHLVGFVMAYASAPLSEVGTAVTTAKQALNLLLARAPAFAKATGVGEWTGSGDYFEFRVFLLN